MRFWKVQALGNDFILFDDRQKQLDLTTRSIKRLCDRHFGVGGDGVLIIRASGAPSAEFEMIYHNADGSLAEMCGNGIRCFAKHLYDHGLTSKERGLAILTGAGVKRVDLSLAEGKVSAVRVDMGPPVFDRASIPMTGEGEAVDLPVEVSGEPHRITAVSMGNPHCVMFVGSLDETPVTTLGPLLEDHALFPRRTNVQFVEVISPVEVRARIWERGVGETLASGTSSCAIVAAGVRRGILERGVTVHLPGGDLAIEWQEGGSVFMTGSAEEVFEGELDLKAIETEEN